VAIGAFGVGGVFVAMLLMALAGLGLGRFGRSDDGSSGRDERGGDRGPHPPETGGGGLAWEVFEREFRAYVSASRSASVL
jgi:hypothetical protein